MNLSNNELNNIDAINADIKPISNLSVNMNDSNIINNNTDYGQIKNEEFSVKINNSMNIDKKDD